MLLMGEGDIIEFFIIQDFMVRNTSYAEFNICYKDVTINFERETIEVVISPQKSDIDKKRLPEGARQVPWGAQAPTPPYANRPNEGGQNICGLTEGRAQSRGLRKR